jgi:prepilin-type processing-associated H-X9-DG protein
LCSLVDWFEPRDIVIEDTTIGFNRVTGRPGIRGPHTLGASALFADGSVHMLEFLIDPGDLRAMLTPAGGENVQTLW